MRASNDRETRRAFRGSARVKGRVTASRQTTRCMRLALAISLGCLWAGCGQPTRRVAPSQLVRLTTGTPGAGFHPLGEALARAFTAHVPDIRLEIHESPGAVTNVRALQDGRADVGFAFADVAYIAYVGGLEGNPRPFSRLRGIAVLQLTPLHVVARAGTGIRTVADLRGKRVGIGPPGSGTALTSGIVLRAFGLHPNELEAIQLPFNEAAHRLVAGALDAAFVNAGYPAESVAFATKAGAHLLPVTGAPVARLRANYPFLRLTFVPGGTYPGHPEPVPTIGVDNLLVCREDLPETLVYELTRNFFDVLPRLSAERISLRMMDLDQAPATPIPLHDGAARYYRELELTR